MKQVKIFALVIMCAAMTGCTGTPASKGTAAESAEKSDSVTGIDWQLLEIRKADTVIDLDRPKLEAEGLGDVFSLRFDRIDGEDRVSGKAAPNRYHAPCTWGDDKTLSIGLAASTMMMAFREPEPLKEREFFDYLSRVKRWALNPEGRLELIITGENGGSTVLVFGKI